MYNCKEASTVRCMLIETEKKNVYMHMILVGLKKKFTLNLNKKYSVPIYFHSFLSL